MYSSYNCKIWSVKKGKIFFFLLLSNPLRNFLSGCCYKGKDPFPGFGKCVKGIRFDIRNLKCYLLADGTNQRKNKSALIYLQEISSTEQKHQERKGNECNEMNLLECWKHKMNISLSFGINGRI